MNCVVEIFLDLFIRNVFGQQSNNGYFLYIFLIATGIILCCNQPSFQKWKTLDGALSELTTMQRLF